MNQPKISVDLILAKMAEDVEKSQKRMLKSKEVLLGPLDTKIASTPHEIVYQEDRVKLKHYFPLAETRVKIPLLIVYALINRETMLDLQPGKSVVENLLKEGIDLYMIDWGYPTRKDRYQGIDDHVNGYLANMVDFVRHRHKAPKINLMGICMGGSFCIMYAALHPEKVKNLITTVSPSNFDTDKGLLNIWAKAIDADLIADTHGNMSGDMLNLCFLLLNPARLMIDKYVGYFENVEDRMFVENFIRMEKWIFDSPDVPGEVMREFINDCYKKNLLIQSKMELRGKRVDLQNITMPVLNIYGRFDHLVPPEMCELLTSRVGSKDTEDMCIETGHIGIYVSGKCQKELAPKIARWLKEREGVERKDFAARPAKAKPKKETGPKTRPSPKRTQKVVTAGR
jgi:polyhydroxyalkanoate synthase